MADEIIEFDKDTKEWKIVDKDVVDKDTHFPSTGSMTYSIVKSGDMDESMLFSVLGALFLGVGSLLMMFGMKD